MEQKRNNAKDKLKMALSGALIGMVNGFFGGGGGMICVPLLKSVMKLDEKQSHANALAVMLPITVVSSILYLTGSRLKDGASMIVLGVLIGGLIGALMLSKVKNRTLNITFSVIMIIAGVRMLWQ